MAPRAPSRGDGIFLSYRRSDSPGHAGRLRDFLVRTRPHDQVFMDVDSIRPGTDFTQVIHSALESTAVMLVVIGPGWLSANADGSPRLDSAEDFVRIEVEAALASDVVVIPVLVEQARMPDRMQLPETLRPLATREAFELRDNRWDRDVADLARAAVTASFASAETKNRLTAEIDAYAASTGPASTAPKVALPTRLGRSQPLR